MASIANAEQILRGIRQNNTMRQGDGTRKNPYQMLDGETYYWSVLAMIVHALDLTPESKIYVSDGEEITELTVELRENNPTALQIVNTALTDNQYEKLTIAVWALMRHEKTSLVFWGIKINAHRVH